MQVDLRGRVANIELPQTQALLPLFECITNSIHAIEDSGTGNGNITVVVHRTSDQHLLDDSESRQRNPIVGFDIIDNGVGFDEENFKAFDMSDTRRKAERGGKGVGRFLWLKAFRKVHVASIFESSEGELKYRKFDFSLHANGITNHQTRQANDERKVTRVSLQTLSTEYEQYIPRHSKTIARRIVEHCLKFFVLRQMPTVVIEDDEEDEPIELELLYEKLVESSQEAKFNIKDEEFFVTHFLLHAQTGMTHKLSFCADNRVVREIALSNRIPDLKPRITHADASTNLIYAGYVSSEHLDSNVNQQRTDFITRSDEELAFHDVSWEEIEAGSVSASEQFLKPYTDPVKEEKRERIRDYVIKSAPQYRNLLKHNIGDLDSIPPDLSDNDLDLELYQIKKRAEFNLREQAAKLINENGSQDGTRNLEPRELREKLNSFLEEWNDLGQANLAQYIVHRKYTLTLLRRCLQLQDDGKYPLEEMVHELIFPLKASSDEVPYENQNLWIIDEKLSYHYYLASDMQLRNVEPVKSSSLERPDLLIFDQPIAMVEEKPPFSGIVIIEFKRPMREDYDSENNPISQVYRYVNRLRSGSAVDKTGRIINVSPNTPFYCYIVGDMTTKLREFAEIHGLIQTPDREGYFGYNPSLSAYIEVVSYDKLVDDADKRNRILFDKLEIPHDVNY